MSVDLINCETFLDLFGSVLCNTKYICAHRKTLLLKCIYPIHYKCFLKGNVEVRLGVHIHIDCSF